MRENARLVELAEGDEHDQFLGRTIASSRYNAQEDLDRIIYFTRAAKDAHRFMYMPDSDATAKELVLHYGLL